MSLGKIGIRIFVFALLVSIALAQETPTTPPAQEPVTREASVPGLSFAATVIDSRQPDRVMMAQADDRGGVDSPVAESPAENFAWFQATMQIEIAFKDRPRIGLLASGIRAVDDADQKHEWIGVAFEENGNEKIFMAVGQFVGRAKIVVDWKTKIGDIQWGVFRANHAGDCMVLAASESGESLSPEKLKADDPLLFIVKNRAQIEVTLLFQVPATSRIAAIQLMPGKEIEIANPKSAPRKGTKRKP